MGNRKFKPLLRKEFKTKKSDPIEAMIEVFPVVEQEKLDWNTISFASYNGFILVTVTYWE